MNDPEQISEITVFGWYDHLNEVFGVFVFYCGSCSLQFGKYSAEVATVSLLFLCLLGFSLGSKREVNRHTERLHRYKGRIGLAITLWLKTPVFVFGVLALSFVAIGSNTKHLAGFSLGNLLGIHL